MAKQVHGAWLPDHEEYFISEIAQNPRFAGGPTIQFRKFAAAFSYFPSFRHAVDIGSNVGLWTRVMAVCFDKVTCFEPNPDCWEAFWLNNENHKDRVEFHPFALGAGPATITINTKLRSTGFTRVDKDGDLLVEQRTLDSFQLKEVDFIKIDVEGWEHNVIKGGIDTIMKNRPIMIVEQKPNNAELHGLKQFGATNLLKKMGAVEVANISGDVIMMWR